MLRTLMKISLAVFIMLSIALVESIKEKDGHFVHFHSFEGFKSHTEKDYAHFFEEFGCRLAYRENCRFINKHNNLYKQGEKSFRMRPNCLADISSRTYSQKFLKLIESKRFETDPKSEVTKTQLFENNPIELDWREKGFLTEPDNQQSCGSCYAFGIAQSIQGQIFKRTGKILNLSTQQIVDCSIQKGNKGCEGGSLRNTLIYLGATGGLMRRKDYPYMARKGECQFVPELAVVNVSSWAILPAKDENAIEKAVAHIGPVAVSINASPKSFQLYSDGIYDDDACTSDKLNHAMLVVGYGKDYWILKNWWGEKWGEGGFMRIRKGKNLCGLANYAAYSVV